MAILFVFLFICLGVGGICLVLRLICFGRSSQFVACSSQLFSWHARPRYFPYFIPLYMSVVARFAMRSWCGDLPHCEDMRAAELDAWQWLSYTKTAEECWCPCRFVFASRSTCVLFLDIDLCRG